MKRKAILIESSNVAGQDHIPGARLDSQNWKNFLLSDLGGSWYESEIVQLSKPQKSEVERLLQIHADHYCFVAFSGHGSDGYITLNEWNQSCPITSITPKGQKGTLVVDSCRGVEQARLYSFSKQGAVAVNESLNNRVVLNARRGVESKFGNLTALSSSTFWRTLNHRNSWDNALLGSSRGVVNMQACSRGQSALENPSAGGFYTSLLLQSAELWQQNASPSTIHTTKDAHDYAAQMLINLQQNPEYSPSTVRFPFGIKA